MTAGYNAADCLVDTLAALGTTDVFTLCGNHILPIAESLRTRDIRVVATRTEASAVMSADGYGRIARRPGVALVTGGPGMANTVTAMLTAQGNRSPVVVISGEPDQDGEGLGAQQEVDHVGLSAPVVKWNRSVRKAWHVEGAIVEAFRVAQSGREGPVHLSLPLDVQRARVRPTPPAVDAGRVVVGAPPRSFVDEAAALLKGASKPVIVAGAGVWQGGGEVNLQALAEATRLPVFTIDSARGAIPDTSPSAFGSADKGLNAAAVKLVEADVVVVVGRSIDHRLGLGTTFAKTAAVVHVDTELETLGRNVRNVRAAFGDPGAFLADLRVALEGFVADAAWPAELAAVREKQQAETSALPPFADGAFHPAAVAETLGRVGNAQDAILALDCGEFVQWCRQVIPSVTPGRWLRLGAQATCGAGLPFGIGAKVAKPGSPVLVIAGDGGIGYHITELETAVRDRVPLVVVVGIDQGWGIERNLQQGIYGPGADFTTLLSDSDFVSVAKGFGAQGVLADSLDGLAEAVEKGLASDQPTLVQIPIQTVPSVVTKGVVAKERESIANEKDPE